MLLVVHELSPFLHAALALRLLFGLHCTVSLHVCDELSTHWTGTTGEREKNAKKLKNESDTKPIGVTYFFFSVLISFLKSFHCRRSLVRTQFWYTSEVFYDVLRLRSHAIIFFFLVSSEVRFMGRNWNCSEVSGCLRSLNCRALVNSRARVAAPYKNCNSSAFSCSHIYSVSFVRGFWFRVSHNNLFKQRNQLRIRYRTENSIISFWPTCVCSAIARCEA